MAEEMATGTREWAGLWLSEERLVPYLEACGGDADRAVELHEWNISLAQVLMRDVAHLEVAMRNAYDRALSDAWGGGAHWLLDDVFFTTTKFRISRLISFGFHRFAKVPHPFFANCPIFPSSRLPRTFCSARRTQPADHDA